MKYYLLLKFYFHDFKSDCVDILMLITGTNGKSIDEWNGFNKSIFRLYFLFGDYVDVFNELQKYKDMDDYLFGELEFKSHHPIINNVMICIKICLIFLIVLLMLMMI